MENELPTINPEEPYLIMLERYFSKAKPVLFMQSSEYCRSPGNAEQAFLALEAKRFRYAFEYDPALGMSVSKVDPLPHQMEAVYEHVLKKSRIRFMLAHDPGAGKTVMAGLIMKELELREGRKRILIVVPGQLKEQWRWEMQDKFDDRFEVVDRAYFEANGKGRVWDKDHLITSIDFAKRDDIAESLRKAGRFDMVVVDEAHKMSAYSQGNSTSKTRRYRLGEILSVNTEHLLFLTATPHKGDTKNFQLLLDLLEPGYLAAHGMIESSIRRKDNPLFLRRAKEDMRDFDNRPLFMPRSVETPDVRLSTKERTLYNAMSKYVKEQYNLALQSSKGHNVTFALIILQRRFASSAFALRESLKRRKGRLAQLKADSGKPPPLAAVSMEKAEEMSEGERWAEESKWELLSMAQSVEDLQTEIDTIDGLIAKTEKILKSGSEAKLKQLKDTIDGLNRRDPGEKILVFTESRDTLNHLVSNVRSWGYSVNTIHGAMPPKERRGAEVVFRDETQIMIATEAAGEGINLQFCHLMINYDLPWNPNRLEQRMGRIHRYGQKHPVSVFNMVAADTREGEIMQVLFEKLEIIKEAMGTDKIFDVISEIVPGKSLSQMLLDATVRARQQKTIRGELEETLSLDNSEVRRYMEDSLASKFIDYSSIEEIGISRERQLVPEYTRDLFERILAVSGGSIEWRGEGIASVTMPPEIVAAAAAAADEGDKIPESYARATFDKRVRMANPGTELLTFGHPAFDAALKWAVDKYSDAAMSGAAFLDASGRLDGHVIFAEGSVRDGRGAKVGRQLLACYVDRHGGATQVSPSITLDFVMRPDSGEAVADGPDLDSARGAAMAQFTDMLEKFAGILTDDRNKEADLDKRYGLKSIDALIGKINSDIAQLLDKKRRGKKADLAIYNKRQERQRYRQSRRDLRHRISTKTRLDADKISIVGIARVHPAAGAEASEARTALSKIKKLEAKLGRRPEVVSGQGYGFDIRSTAAGKGSGGGGGGGGDGVERYRYIQVKAVAEGARVVTFTPNEWFRARMLGRDCYLYLMDGSRLRTVRDPAGSLTADHAESGYGVDVDQVRKAVAPS